MASAAERPESCFLHMAAPTAEPVVASPSERTISGLAVPFGPSGNSSLGAITFARGALSYSETGRVKLLFQHDPEQVLGYATSLTEQDDGLHATFHVPESPEGDRALAEAADGRRDGLSVGVMLDEETLEEVIDKWLDGDATPTAAAGELLEVSQVSIPAFRDSRIDGSAAAALSGHITLSVDFATPTRSKENAMPTSATRSAAPSEQPPVEETATAQAPEVERPEPGPAAVAGAAVVSNEAPVYTFDGTGPSFVRDVYYARFEAKADAQDRLRRFSEMLESDSSQVSMLTAAVETRSTLDTFIQEGYRPDMLIAAIDKGRPLTSRIGTVPLSDATPFRIPIEGDFTGVGDHTEGTKHTAEGDLTAGEVTIQPGAISGAYRISRELVDASNPALDTLAVRAMARDYRSQTEAKVAAALLAADSSATLSINTVMKLRAELGDYYDLADEPASFVAASSSYYNTLAVETDSTGRPMLASVNPSNAVGTASPGWTGASVDGVELVKSSKVAVDDAFILRSEDVFIGESPLRTFRFDEVEGPGVIKLALWSYFAAKVTRAGSVVQITSAAA